MDYEFLKDLPDKGRNYVVCLLLADHDVDAFFTAVQSGYKVDSWVLEWLLLSKHAGYINQLLKEEKATFTEDARRFLKAYLGEPAYKTWLAEFEAQQKKIREEKKAAEEQAKRESLQALVEKEGLTHDVFFAPYSTSMLVELYGEEKVYEEAKKLGIVWQITCAFSDDFLFSKKEYRHLKATLENAHKLIEIGEFPVVYEWSTWDFCPQIRELLNKENPAYFLERKDVYSAYPRISEESKENFTDEQWIGYYDRFPEDVWMFIPLKDRHYLVDAMTRAKRRKFLWEHRYYGKWIKTFFC